MMGRTHAQIVVAHTNMRAHTHNLMVEAHAHACSPARTHAQIVIGGRTGVLFVNQNLAGSDG